MAASQERQDVERLKELLGVAGNRSDVDRISTRLEDRVVRAQDVADVLPESLRAANTTGRLGPVLAQPVEEGIRDLIRRDPQALGETLFPVIGPAIRRAISEAMKSLVQGLNTAMEQKFSARGMRWRMESWRTGVPFREVVLKHTLEYRVRQVFLIDSRSGLLMAHAGGDALGVDEDAVSAMLMAIQDFVRDSIGDDDSEALSSAELDDETLWVLTGPHAQLAAVIEGFPPRTLRTHLAQRLENMHGAYDHWMSTYPETSEPPSGLTLMLEECLRSEAKEGASSGSAAKAVALIALGLVILAAALGWWWWKENEHAKRVAEVERRIESMPGRALIAAETIDGQTVIRGLSDPLADPVDSLLDGLDFGERTPILQWKPYRSAEQPLVLRRVQQVLNPPSTVNIEASENEIVISGVAPVEWISRARDYADFYDNQWPLNLLQLEAETPPAPPPPQGPTLGELVERINNAVVQFKTGTAFAPGSEAAIEQLVGRLLETRSKAEQEGRSLNIRIVGMTDQTGPGPVNRQLRVARAQILADRLEALGAIDANYEIEVASNRPYQPGPAGRQARVEVRVID